MESEKCGTEREWERDRELARLTRKGGTDSKECTLLISFGAFRITDDDDAPAGGESREKRKNSQSLYSFFSATWQAKNVFPTVCKREGQEIELKRVWAILKGVVGLAATHHHPLAYTPSYSSPLALSLRHFCVNVCQVGCHRGHHHRPHHSPLTPPPPFSLKWSLVAQQSVWCCCFGGCCCWILLLLLSGDQRGVHMVYIRLSSTPMHTHWHTPTHTHWHTIPQKQPRQDNPFGAYL